MSWESFTRGLAAGIGRNCVEDVVILAWDDLGFVQFMQDADEIRLEVSDHPDLPLTDRQRAALAAAGWNAPRAGFGSLCTRDVRWRPDRRLFDEVAELITVTLHEVIGVRSPNDLSVKAFSIDDGVEFALPFTPAEYARAAADVDLRLADVQLHEATATYVISKEVPSARTVAVPAQAAHRRPTRDDAGEYYLDRVLLVEGDDPHIVVWSHVGPSGQTGSRLVSPSPQVEGPFIRAEQGSGPYVRGLLQRNKTVAAALAADPETYERMTALLSTGRADAVRAKRIAVDAEGVISTYRMPLAPHDIDVPTLRLPPPAGADRRDGPAGRPEPAGG